MEIVKRFGVWNEVLIIGDPHLGKKIYQKDDSLVFERLETALKSNENFSSIIILGDMFDVPSPDFCTIVKTVNVLRKYHNYTNIYVLEGNHDQKKDLSKKRIFDVLKMMSLPNIHFISHPQILDSDTDDLKYLLLPYSDTEEAKEKARNSASKIKGDYILFAHLELDETSEDYVKNAKQVFSGHDHTPRVQNNICWVGSLTPLDKTQDVEKEVFKTASLEEVLTGNFKDHFVEVFVNKNEKVPEEVYGNVRACRIVVVEDDTETAQDFSKTDFYINPLQRFNIYLKDNNLEEIYSEIVNFR